MKTMPHTLFILIAFLLAPLAASAEEMPQLLFERGEKTELTLNKTIAVRSELIQIQIGPHSILSAKKGDEFQIRQASPDNPEPLSIAVITGHVMLYDLANNNAVNIKAGTTLTGPNRIACTDSSSAGCLEFRIHPESASFGAEPESLDTSLPGSKKNLALSSFVMTKQQKYLDSIRIDVRDINNVLGSILRGFGSRTNPPQP